MIRVLRNADDRSRFRSGDPDIDRFFHKYAGQNQFRQHIGVTYVAEDSEGTIVGFCTISVGTIEGEALPQTVRKKLPSYPLPVLRLARLGVDEQAQGAGLGGTLLAFALRLALRLSEEYGCLGVVVDAKPGAVAFYEKFGFRSLATLEGELADRPPATPMFLSIGEIRAAIN